MSSSVRKLLAVGLGCGLAVGLWACQSYELQQVEPKAFAAVVSPVPVVGKMERPYIMLVIDKSGSMLDTADETAKCANTFGEYAAGQPCKWTDLLEAFADPSSGFLPMSKDLARFGLSVYPDGDSCQSGRVLVPLNGENDNVDTIMAQLHSVAPVGGTPTAPTLDAIAQDPKLLTAEEGRLRFVMLLTDGLPNCNHSEENQQRCDACNANPNTVCFDPAQNGCQPTFGGVASQPCDVNGSGYVKGDSCLDGNGTVEAVKRLREQGVDTFVIGFGRVTASGSSATQILNTAAIAGGRPRDGDVRYYQAGNKEELKSALSTIIGSIQSCDFSIDPAPTNENVFQVIIWDSKEETETVLRKGTDWQFKDASMQTLQILEPQCGSLQNAKPNRYEIRFQYATSM